MVGRPKHGLSYTLEYRAWQQMRLRCTNPKHAAYPAYGGRGITVCARWLASPQAFLDDMGPKPSPHHELDRIDNNRGYEPGNCRWATRKTNDRNRRNNRLLDFRGERLALAEWCERLNLPRDTVRKRLESGRSVEAALTTPVRQKAPNGAGRRSTKNLIHTRGLLAGVSKGRYAALNESLTHAVPVDKHGYPTTEKTLCGRIMADHLVDPCCAPEDHAKPPTCARCLAKDPRW